MTPESDLIVGRTARGLRGGLPDRPQGGSQGPEHAAFSGSTPRRSRAALFWIPVLAAVHLGQSLPMVSRAPRAVMDESWEASTGYALFSEGRLRNPVIQDRAGIDRAFVQPRVTQSLVLAAAYQLLGFSLGTGRAASVGVGLLAVVGVFYLMRTWLSPGLAGLTALLFASETRFFLVARLVRPEVYLLCASVWMLALLARGAARPSVPMCILAGIVGAVGCYTHPHMAFFAILAPVVVLIQIGPRSRAWAVLGAFALGGFVGVIPFFAWVAYAHGRYGVSFFEQLGYYYTHIHTVSFLDTLRGEAGRWWRYLQPLYRAPWVVVLALGILAAIRRRHPVQLWALVLIFGHALLMAALIRRKSSAYLVVLSPWLAGLVVVWAWQLWHRAAGLDLTTWRRRLRRAVAVGGIALCLANQLAGNAYVLYTYRNADYDGVCQRIRQHIPAAAPVYGDLFLWTGLHEYPFLSDIYEQRLRRSTAVASLQARLIRFRPEYVVRSTDPCSGHGGLGPRNTDPKRRSEGTSCARARMLQDEYLDRYLQRCGRLVDQFTTRDYGTIQIHHIRR